MTFLSTSMMVVIMFLLPVRKVCIPSLKRKMTVNELLNIWNMEGIFLERERERESKRNLFFSKYFMMKKLIKQKKNYV